MTRTRRTSKRARRFAATCRVLHMLKPRRLDDTISEDLEGWMLAAGADQ